MFAKLAATTVKHKYFYQSIFPLNMILSLLNSLHCAYLVFTSTGISFLILVSTFLVFCFTGTISFSGFSAIIFPFCFSGSYKRQCHIKNHEKQSPSCIRTHITKRVKERMMLENMSIFGVLKVFFHDLMILPIKYSFCFFYLEKQKCK